MRKVEQQNRVVSHINRSFFFLIYTRSLCSSPFSVPYSWLYTAFLFPFIQWDLELVHFTHNARQEALPDSKASLLVSISFSKSNPHSFVPHLARL